MRQINASVSPELLIFRDIEKGCCGSGVESASRYLKVAGLIPLICMSKFPMARYWTPKLLLMCWSAPCTAATAISVWITVSRFGQKLLLNVKYLQETLEIDLFSRLGLRTCWTEGICVPNFFSEVQFEGKSPTRQILTLCNVSRPDIQSHCVIIWRVGERDSQIDFLTNWVCNHVCLRCVVSLCRRHFSHMLQRNVL